jgi:hypothetical protein
MKRFTGHALIDCANPVIRDHPHNRDKVAWYLNLLGLSGGARWHDLMSLPGDIRQGPHATLTSIIQGPSSGWQGTNRPGGLGHLACDGTDDYADAGSPTVLRIMGRITVACWFRLTSLNLGTSPVLCGIGFDGTQVGYALGWNQTGGAPTDRLEFLSYLGSPNGVRTTKTWGTGDLGLWYHVMGTWDGAAWHLYINGVEDSSAIGAGTTGPRPSTARFLIASEEVGLGTVTRRSAVAIDDVGVWSNRAFSPAEARDYYWWSQARYPGGLRRIGAGRLSPVPAGGGASGVPRFQATYRRRRAG